MFKVAATNQCMFSGITTCSRDYFNFTNIVCSKHSKDIFNLSNAQTTLYSTKYETKNVVHTTSENACMDEIPLMPFPIAFKTVAQSGNADPFTYNGHKLCIDQPSIVNCVTAFINSKNLTTKGYSTTHNQQVIHTLITYIADASFHSNHVNFDNSALQNYNSFITQNQQRLAAYWKDTNSIVSIIVENNIIIEFPVIKLPTFYQAMLARFEFSQHKYAARNGVVPPVRYLIHNCIINSISKMITTFNQTEDNPIYKDLPGTNFASALILAGSVRHTTQIPYNIFEKPEVYPGGVFSNTSRPSACN